jgi:cell division protein FtsI (penicillin-binding protein 3)
MVDVAGPVLKNCTKDFDVPSTNEIKNIDRKVPKQEKNYNNYFAELQKPQQSIPNVKGMPGMDAIALIGEFRGKS